MWELIFTLLCVFEVSEVKSNGFVYDVDDVDVVLCEFRWTVLESELIAKESSLSKGFVVDFESFPLLWSLESTKKVSKQENENRGLKEKY